MRKQRIVKPKAVHRIEIPQWRPASLNDMLCCHWTTANRLKKSDRETITAYSIKSEIPKAEGKRRVSLEIHISGRQQEADPDAYWKSLLDGLTRCGMLVDDQAKYCQMGTVTYYREESPEARKTIVVLEDLYS
jgi:hypothetical protein